MIKKILGLGAVLLSVTVAYSQQPDILPKGFYEGEEELMDDYLNNIAFNVNRGVGITTPPTGPVRSAAQWEEIQALVITWTSFPSILAQIVDAAQEECTVIIHCTDSIDVKSDLTSYSVPLTNVKYIEVPFNSIWIRDYGANTVYMNDVDSLILVDWIYNRPRPDDDAIPEAYSTMLNIPLFQTTASPNNLMNTGGNWMIDGIETAFASDLILDENDGGGVYPIAYPTHTESEIDQIVDDFQGINRYIKMDVLPYDGIHHIDMHMKLLDEETILVGEFPTGVSDGPQIEANIQYILNNFNDPWNDPYKIVRIPMPPSTGGGYAGAPWGDAFYRTYTNFVIVNKTVIMPVYRQEYDTTAVRIVKESMPGYNVVTIDADNPGANLISWGGVIHCITHTIGVTDPLRIVHNPLSDTNDDVNPYTVDAIVQHKSGIANATIYWTTDTASVPYSQVSMTNTSGDNWSGDIPAQSAGSTVYYYVHAQANSGKQQVRPMVAPDGIWQFDVTGGGTQSLEDNLTGIFTTGLFPNPSHGITCIPFNTERELTGNLYVTDMHGRIIHNIYSGTFPIGENKYFINTSEWSAGAYLVVANTNEGMVSQKLLVRK